MEPMTFLDGLSGFMRNSTGNSADRPIRIAKIDPAYDPFLGHYPNATDPARVIFEGETTVSGKAYPVASGYVPQAGARVYMVPIGNSWLIAGAVTQYTTQGFFSDPEAALYGVEFGGGSFFDSGTGLHIEGDTEILGDLDVGGIGAVRTKWKTIDTGRSGTITSTADPILQGLFLEQGTWEIFCGLNVSATGTSPSGGIRTQWGFSGTWTALRTCLGPSDVSTSRTNTTVRIGSEGTGDVSYGLAVSGAFTGITEYGIVTVATAGNFSILWAQAVSSAQQSFMRQRSYIKATRIG